MQINAHYLTLPTKICIVVSFCVNAVIALPAQSIFFTTLANFDRADGSNPSGTLVQAADGDFYGTTANGGIGSSCCGTVFVVSPTGTLTAIYDFCSEPNCAEGSFPVAGLVQAPDGSFSGTTRMGGMSAATADPTVVARFSPSPPTDLPHST